MQRLLPDPGPTTVTDQLAAFEPATMASAERPFVYVNFAVTIDGQTAIEGRSGPIGSDTDTAMLVGLRTRSEAVMIGAGTMRAEQYGRLIPDPAKRERRVGEGLAADPLAIIVGSLDLPWDAGLFTCGEGEVVILTRSEDPAPETATPLSVLRSPGGVDLAASLRELRTERGVRSLLCEGGPRLFAGLLREDLVDDLFLTTGALIGGGESARLAAGVEGAPIPVALRWLLSEGSELFARYAIAARHAD